LLRTVGRLGSVGLLGPGCRREIRRHRSRLAVVGLLGILRHERPFESSDSPYYRRCCESGRNRRLLSSPSAESTVTLAESKSADSADGDEVDELLDASGQGRFDIGDGGHFPEDARPAAGDIPMIAVRPPDAPQDPGLPILAAGNDRPLIDADDMRFDRLPDIDVG